MLLTISTTHRPATDLGYLLHKHPDRIQEFVQSFGTTTVLYPEATDERCTALVCLEIDPIRLARSRRRGSPDFGLAQYVNDRPYAASSLLGGALADVFSTARAGRCASRQELADSALPLELEIPVLPCRGGPELAERLFGPLGWQVQATPIPLDEAFPEWGDSRYLHVVLRGTIRLADALNQLYVLLPVLDEAKHYWQASDEVDKLLRSGGAWLAGHPEQELIARRYLGRRGALTRLALERLAELGDDTAEAIEPACEEEVGQPEERRVPLNAQRHRAVLDVLLAAGAASVIDLGCGQGQFLRLLLEKPRFARIGGADVSASALATAERRLRLDRMGDRQRERLSLFQGSVTYEDDRFAGYDAAVLMEVIEHIDPSRLAALARVVFGVARPGTVVVTTPNVEYNQLYAGLTGARHADHRFEWTRAEFAAWAERVAAAYGYTVEVSGIGDPDEVLGQPTQLGVFRHG
ncbi:MAG TPA: 3' terminal RNA ribose 2'-O-methyltransferase Hen1 [Nocardioides bacterium]|uniref:3' terminal RNA ribose 2'-O-methyltransferase Hen1 n=1 Tax=uncultured Nocardioides sp. TaxID=198441 RepID=UPI000EC31246|nr:3' terminal RNA ribose 2'-O-methyltransferase Hen1 [uncultured Nocardioides sp.]HCB06907.1 3' terminal RNA ribose 2'-O-methyltransferase Hen1 [Nocardioides sp.]